MAYPETWQQAGLVGGWHLNGSSTDFSGNNNHGTDTSITYSQANGKFGQGAGFNGSSSFIDCGTSATLRPTTFTIVAWVKPSGTGIKTIKSGGATNSYQFRINNVTPELIHEQAGGIATATATVTLNVWNHVAVSYDASGNYAFYVNGNSAGTGTNLKSFSFGNFFIGKQYTGAEWFNGAIDELLLFNRVLTAQEIRRMYAVGTGKLQ